MFFKKWKKSLALGLVGVTLSLSLLSPFTVHADREDAILDKPYVSLGADLKPSEKVKVLELLDIKEEELKDYTVVTITNEEEHKYLDSYLDKSVIGSRSLSSVKVVGKEAGNGIKVTTKNIGYCTVGMYQNALVTAGIKDAEITVAGPFKISGTAALVGAIKSYGNMTGTKVATESVETATNELVLTAELAEEIGDSTKAEELVGVVKDIVVSQELNSEPEIVEVIEQTSSTMDIKLSDDTQQQLVRLMKKIEGLDLDIDNIKEQAKELYNKLENLDLEGLNISQEQVDGFFAKIGVFFTDLFSGIKDFFQNLFN